MPNRIIKESIHGSEKLNTLTDFQYRLWVGLITYVDDYGRGDARPAIIKGTVFPLRDRVTAKDIQEALLALAGAGCVGLYEVDGKPYLYFPNWERHQRIQTKKSKYPAPQESTVIHREIPPESNPNPNTNPNPNIYSADEPRMTAADQVSEILGDFGPELVATAQDWLAYKKEKRQPYKPVGLKNLLETIAKNAGIFGVKAVIEVMESSMAANYQGIVWDKLKDRKPERPNKIQTAETYTPPKPDSINSLKKVVDMI